MKEQKKKRFRNKEEEIKIDKRQKRGVRREKKPEKKKKDKNES